MNNKVLNVIKKLEKSGVTTGEQLASFGLDDFMNSQLSNKEDMRIVTEIQKANGKSKNKDGQPDLYTLLLSQPTKKGDENLPEKESEG